ncbi:MAG: aldo/keto reductase [Acidobacteriota bacterium]
MKREQDQDRDVEALAPGSATAQGTDRFRGRFTRECAPDHFRKSRDLWFSSLGIGTYLGEPDRSDDERYRQAIVTAVRSGCNVIDTAINYRFQRSERSVGAALRDLFAEGFAREEIVVATKGGFIPFDGAYPEDPADWFRTALLRPGLARPDDVVANCHIMTPRFLEAQIEWSRKNLGLEKLDIYFLHNPETQLQALDRAEFLMRVRAAFELFERKVEEGVLGLYGVTTWDGLRVPAGRPGHLSLEELLVAARHAGGEGHHFRVIQAPLNLIMPEACLAPTQRVGGHPACLLTAASASEMIVMASASLLQGQVVLALEPDGGRFLPGALTNAQRGLQVVRSVPGLTTALVGMKSVEHVRENLGLARVSRLEEEKALALLRRVARPEESS